MKTKLLFGAAAVALAILAHAQSGRSYGPNHIWWEAGQGEMLPWQEEYDNPDGQIQVLNKNGAVHTKDHPFFEALGTNGRACVTCHQPSNAMSVSVKAIRGRWDETEGTDPLFAAVDGSNCPDQPQPERASHSLLLDRGLFRIALPWPPKGVTPEFRIELVRDPSGCNSSPRYGLASARAEISVFRRPRVAANLGTLVRGPQGAVLMADGREPDLKSQAITAALVHEGAASAPDAEALRRILDFETQIYAAQNSDLRGGMLGEQDGPSALGPQNLVAGSAGVLDKSALVSFAVWTKPGGDYGSGVQREFRASVARGSRLFASREFRVGSAIETCASCHASGTTRWMDVGTANLASAEAADRELPLFKITCASSGRVVYTQDPGRALISGKCEDLGRIVIPQFRGLAARAPYFSNGSAATLRDVVDHYERQYRVGLSEEEKRDLVNFLRVL